MKTFFRILLYFISFIIIIALGALSYVYFALPDIEKKDITVESTPAKVEKGKYLAMHVMVCMDCHSTRNWDYFAGPLKENTIGIGGEYFGPKMGLPGKLYSSNITPYNLGDWTDAEIFRTITSGVKKNGEPIFPIMPYPAYSHADTEDIKAVIAYLRQIESKESKVSTSQLQFPMNLIVRTIPEKAHPEKKPNPSDTLAYGKYLTKIAACKDCHTPFEKGAYVEGMDYAGGREFELPNGDIVRSANLTPTKNGFGQWTEDRWVRTFKSYVDSTGNPLKIPIKQKGYQTIMPWSMYGGMKKRDLRAIYTYLQSLKPIENAVVKYTSAE